MIKISIIILTFNCEDVIAENLSSLLCQKFPNSDYEIIIIDDHSRDYTVSIVEKFASKKNKIKLYKLDHNHGNGYCKNLGLKLAKGKIVFFLDDHLYLKDKKTISKMYTFLKENPKLAGVCGNYISPNRSDYNICRDIRRFVIYDKNKVDMILCPDKFTPFSIVISALNMNIIKKGIFFPEDFKKNAAEDVFFQIQQHERGLSFAYMADIVGIHGHNESLSNLIRKSKRELNGFSCVLEKMATNKYFRSIYLPCFFSFPLLFWISVLLYVFIPWTIWITMFLLGFEFIILLPIFQFPIKFSVKLKTFLYCFLTENGKIFYILKSIIKRPTQIFNISTQLIIWEFKKIIYIYENRFKKSSPHKITATKSRS